MSAANFEKQVFEKIAKCDIENAEFNFGTLFVETQESVARQIFSVLFNADFGTGRYKVVVSKFGNEYAYDFIA